MARKKRIVAIGAAGYIFGQMLPTFRERYDLTLLDVKETNRAGEKIEGVQIANLLDPDPDANRHHFKGADGIVHCGFAWGGDANAAYQDQSKFETEMRNIEMVRNVFELARLEGVKRVVVASSNHAADWYEPLLHTGQMDVVSPETFPLSDNYYGWAKACYEHLGFMYATGKLGVTLEVAMIRIGAPRPLRLELFGGDKTRYKRDLGAWISPRDKTQLFLKSLETESLANEWGVPYQAFYGISGNARAFWSIVNARKVIGYAPVDDSEREYADDIRRMLYSG